MKDRMNKGERTKLTRRGFGALAASLGAAMALVGARKSSRRGRLSFREADHWESVKKGSRK